MAKAKPVTQTTTAEAELAGLVTTRISLQARQSALAVEVEQAVATRRLLLIEDGDAAAIAEAERACREIEGTAYGITDALAEIERRIGETEGRIETARADADRERIAGGLERNASEIDAAVASLAKTLTAVAKAHAMLGITISGAAAGQFDPLQGPADPMAIANALLLQGLAHAMPGLEIHAEVRPWSLYSLRALVEGDDPVTIATGFGQRLRETAGMIRSREIDHGLIAGQDFALPETVSRPEAQIYVISPFQYHRKANAPEMVTSPIAHVPLPVAERAIELGVAAASETLEWRRARKGERGGLDVTTTSYAWEDCVDIEFDLDAWITGQRQAA